MAGQVASALVMIIKFCVLHYFFTFFTLFGKGSSKLSAMIVDFFTVNTLLNVGRAFTVGMFNIEKHIVSTFYNPLTWGMWMFGNI